MSDGDLDATWRDLVRRARPSVRRRIALRAMCLVIVGIDRLAHCAITGATPECLPVIPWMIDTF